MGQLAKKLGWKEKWTGISIKAGKATRAATIIVDLGSSL
jgi:hypothetical protein